MLAAAVIVGVVVGGLSADDDGESATTTAPTLTTPSPIANAVWERSYSECGAATVDELAAKYKVDRTEDAVATAVARDWMERFDGGEDTVAVGRAACFASMEAQ